MRGFAIVATLTILGGCATNIHPTNEPLRPPTVRLGIFPQAVLAPIKVEKMEGDSGDQAAIRHMDENLGKCMKSVFPTLLNASAADQGLLIEPVVVDMKKVNASERFWLGAMAGSSAVLLKLRYTDVATKAVVAEPTFYARAAAMSGAWTIGGADNAMLSRVVNEACGYARSNL